MSFDIMHLPQAIQPYFNQGIVVSMLTTQSTHVPKQLADMSELLRSNSVELDSILERIDDSSVLGDSRAITHFHVVRNDGNGRPMVKHLADMIFYYVLHYTIPRKKYRAAISIADENKKVVEITRLHEDARRLFAAKIKTSGEGGELLLYLFAEKYLKLPQVMCKMSLKTSGEMHIHGTDGIHMAYDRLRDKLLLYWGESKLYQKAHDAIKACFKSLAPYLTGEGACGDAQDRDLTLFRNNIESNIDDPLIENAIIDYLDYGGSKYGQIEYRAICLIGFDESGYRSNIEEARVIFKNSIAAWRTLLSEEIKANLIQDFHIDVFCVPFPSVQDFRDYFLGRIRGQHDK